MNRLEELAMGVLWVLKTKHTPPGMPADWQVTNGNEIFGHYAVALATPTATIEFGLKEVKQKEKPPIIRMAAVGIRSQSERMAWRTAKDCHVDYQIEPIRPTVSEPRVLVTYYEGRIIQAQVEPAKGILFHYLCSYNTRKKVEVVEMKKSRLPQLDEWDPIHRAFPRAVVKPIKTAKACGIEIGGHTVPILFRPDEIPNCVCRQVGRIPLGEIFRVFQVEGAAQPSASP